MNNQHVTLVRYLEHVVVIGEGIRGRALRTGYTAKKSWYGWFTGTRHWYNNK